MGKKGNRKFVVEQQGGTTILCQFIHCLDFCETY